MLARSHIPSQPGHFHAHHRSHGWLLLAFSSAFLRSRHSTPRLSARCANVEAAALAQFTTLGSLGIQSVAHPSGSWSGRCDAEKHELP
jgi:hypothetical protein